MAEETEIPKVAHRDHVDNFFLISMRTAEFNKGVMDRVLECIDWVRPAVYYSEIFFLHDNVPEHTAASFSQFLTQNNVTTL